MALPGLDEKFDRRANTKQITGESGTPLADVNGNILATSNGPGASSRTYVVDRDVGQEGGLVIDIDETYGTNVVHVFVESDNGDGMEMRQEIEDSDGNVVNTVEHTRTVNTELIDTVIPILSDASTIYIDGFSPGDAPVLKGTLMFTSGNESAISNYNLGHIDHESVSVGGDGENTQLDGIQGGGVPQGFKLAIKAPQSNTGTVYIGDSDFPGTVDDTTGFPLSAGEGVELNVRDASNIEAHFPDSTDELVHLVEAPYSG